MSLPCTRIEKNKGNMQLVASFCCYKHLEVRNLIIVKKLIIRNFSVVRQPQVITNTPIDEDINHELRNSLINTSRQILEHKPGTLISKNVKSDVRMCTDEATLR